MSVLIDRGFLHVLLLATAVPAFAQQTTWKDSSPHRVELVAVDGGVQLEVLDWRGSGPALVLLAGLGDTAHVFDDFAQALIPRHRVVGVTRRGFGRSSPSPSGYGFARLAEDVARVIATLGLDRPLVIGHSFAGEEMHLLGARHSAAISGLVYVDAAFNRADDFDEDDEVERTLPPPPAPGPADLASFVTLRAFLQRTQGAVGPDAHLRSRYVANDSGAITGPWMPDPTTRQGYTSEMQAARKRYEPERIRVPALAVYAVPKVVDDLMRPWYAADDPAVRERVQTLYPLTREQFFRHRKWFEGFAERGRVEELAGPHYLPLTHPRELVALIEAFAESLR
ncbi:MAG TPA: alpha/beta hydrolase [Vicinamibacterales bacterium]|nr:alpha/beta hydrolase [Vicinamibacterales bacterium]